MKKHFVLILAFFAIALGASFFFWQKETAREDGSSKVETKIYDSVRYGFSFAYPTEYLLSEHDAGTPERERHSIVLFEDTTTGRAFLNGTLTDTEGPPAITMDIFQNPEHLSAADWVKGSAYSNFKLSDGTYEEVSLSGEPAVHYFWDGLYRGESIVVEYRDTIIMLSATSLDPRDRINADFSTIVRSFDFRP